jgi:hypothetical protein
VSIYINNDNGFEQPTTLSRDCPHCGAHAQLLPIATPAFAAVAAARPRHVGLVFRCAACNEPRFLRATVRAVDPDRIELSSQLTEIERAPEPFQYDYLPAGVALLFREAMACYAAGCFNAFASMCRRTIEAALDDVGRNAKLRWYDLYKDAVRIGAVDELLAQPVEAILFGGASVLPEIGADQAAVLIEVIKDMLYQWYVRTAKLRAALDMRRYFAGDGADNNITPIGRHNRRAESA